VKKLALIAGALLFSISLLSTALASDAVGNSANAPQDSSAHVQVQTPPSAKPSVFGPSGKIGLGVKISSLGVGVEAAAPVMSHANVRVGFNFFNYDRTLSQDGVTYVGKLNFRSTEAYFDWFPLHGSFHLSPGLLVYNGNKVTANSLVTRHSDFHF
jgi:hypothetical protein